MRFEPRHHFVASRQVDHDRKPAGDADGADPVDLPPEIAFLAAFHVDAAWLRWASETAHRYRLCAAKTLIAEGGIEATRYYRMLAYHLGVTFIDDLPSIALPVDLVASHRTGCVALGDPGLPRWLVAPEGDVLRSLFHARRLGVPDLAITTPAHFAVILHHRAQAAVEHAASKALPSQTPRLSAKGAVDARVGVVTALTAVAGLIALLLVSRLAGDVLGLLFFAGIIFRLGVSVEGFSQSRSADPRALTDDILPDYTVLVPLRQEARLVPDLLRALDAIDYPRAKLEVLVLVEPEDIATRAALAVATLPPWVRIVVGPTGGTLRTKPRALNIGLLMARGALITVYDAEDRPDADQLRQAAAAFHRMPEDIACLQARLSIDNGRDNWWSRLFAIEYAALFDVFNVGIATHRLPMALGGTSNHFRTAILRAVGGWDAWNVTEDADLGLRLARLGYRTDCLSCSTMETAPDAFLVWFRQRRRWTKGWMQTFLVLARDAPNVVRNLRWRKSSALALLMVNLVVGPLLSPMFCCFVVHHLAVAGLPTPSGPFQIGEATLEASVLLFGILSVLWCGYAGLRLRRLPDFMPSLPLLLPYQLLISVAAWMGLIELIFQPYHWHKTPHRPLAKDSPP